jgi:hypothetical protein
MVPTFLPEIPLDPEIITACQGPHNGPAEHRPTEQWRYGCHPARPVGNGCQAAESLDEPKARVTAGIVAGPKSEANE